MKPRGAAAVATLAGGWLSFASCSSSKSSNEEAGGTVDVADPRPQAPPEWDRPVARADESVAAASRASCRFGRGALPDETLGTSIPTGRDLPLETIVVLMQENRSFDHYFGRFGRYAGTTDIDGIPDDARNVDTTGVERRAERAKHLCFADTTHSWKNSRTQWNEGRHDGFVATNDDVPNDALLGGARAMWWYDERELPFYYALARSFALGDRYFCSLLGPTWPNRMFLFSATSFGLTENFFPRLDAYPYPREDALVLDQLDKRRVDWKLYSEGGPPGAATVVGLALSQRWGRPVVFTMDDFFRDAAAGTLPPVTYVDADFLKTDDPEGSTEHPPSNIQAGQRFTSGIVRALFASPQWKNLALFITYDEHGGLYDHVPPPKACAPDSSPPIDEEGEPVEGAFDHYGFRVPFLVVSPFARKGFVSHGVYDHTSILRLVQARHRLPALTARDANANVPLDMFDFANPPNLVPPELPEATLDPVEREYCRATFRSR